jgi:hypothetical protein
VVEALDLGAGSTPADAHTQAVAPDDTPTRLEQIQQRFQTGTVRFDDAHWLVAEVSRLQHSLTEKEELLKQIMRTVHVGTFQAAPVAVEGLSESVSRLQQENAAVVSSLTKAISKIEQVVEENALLKRSLEMLTKQMAQDR